MKMLSIYGRKMVKVQDIGLLGGEKCSCRMKILSIGLTNPMAHVTSKI
jgi:hypothetical protein